MQEARFNSWVRQTCWKRHRPPAPVFLGFPGGSAGKESSGNAGDLGSIRGLGRSPGEGNGYPLQYPGLENSMECIVHGVTMSWTRLSHFHPLFPTPFIEKTISSPLCNPDALSEISWLCVHGLISWALFCSTGLCVCIILLVSYHFDYYTFVIHIVSNQEV